MKKNLLILILSTLCTTLSAQQKIPAHDRIESYKIAFITEKLNLSPKEAEVFWPVYNEYKDQLQAIRNKDKEKTRLFKALENPTDAESDKFITDNLGFRQQETDLVRKYIVEFKKVLPAPKVARLITLEQEFKLQLLHKIKERGQYDKP